MNDIRVAIVEDEKEIRESLAVLVKGSQGFSLVGAFASAEDALKGITNDFADVVLMDIHLPGKNGIECVEILKPKLPHTQFVMCTSFEDTESVFRALKAGATGYLVKTTQPSKLLDAILDASRGGSPMSNHIARKVVESFQQTHVRPETQKLSAREKEILDLLSKGLRYKEIADKIFVSTETVRTHIRNIYEKLQVNSRTEALNKVYGR